ncbi:MAG: hypothetical protein A3G05_01705 [Candidatus Zambryskibacteria bacterium RIFCSPLOWO2_12_FULL_45_14]|uniref:DUF192 domain-containing protein n=1 Tax=Candidatus Zambryskibacteria bacterium RIFCSPLOWO2_12_FULL_45_14 TaxID=1802778 RepID=A0A1G2UXG1_9BACT|nr:MAG: hypothetical protein A3G05_01705 [Candidatus Zambryskibacteria bacterium RIFCSPLOWO2_12_FULL_45_14]
MRNLFFLVLGLVIIFGSIFLVFRKDLINENQVKVIKVGEVSIQVEVVNTLETRARGLSGRKSLAENMGMLFVFDQSGKYGFWMKDMNFAIDIVWIDEGLQVIGITKEVTPETFPEVFYPPGPVRYVLELPSGKSRDFGIDIDQVVFLGTQSTQSE